MNIAFELFLDDISRAFLKCDFELWRSRLELPLSLITKSNAVVLETEDAVVENFALYLQAVDVMGLDLIHRTPISLEKCPDGTWLGTFQTRLLRQETLTTPPYTSTALLHDIDGRFAMSSMLNARGHTEWTGPIDG
ncbi:hypothetical protein NBRC116594_04130 [Shimia sp. NS0008-38b]|uniref:hypothetical protein n=1 Tax=Shimia sp. NS0008-38b TaxID=3127653 RepID=UPI0031020FF9